jgi:hypothetical protein
LVRAITAPSGCHRRRRRFPFCGFARGAVLVARHERQELRALNARSRVVGRHALERDAEVEHEILA